MNRTVSLGFLCAITLIPIHIKTFTMKSILYYLAKDLILFNPIELNHDKNQT